MTKAFTLTALIALAVSTPTAAPTLPGPGRFVWHDLVTDHAERSRTFYGSLFGWTFEDAKGLEPGYTLIKQAGEPIGGIVPYREKADGARKAQWLSYVVVADVKAAADAFAADGGTIFRGPVDVRSDLKVAVVTDAQGAPLGLASRGRPTEAGAGPPAVNRWLWMEYVAKDAPKALTFLSRTLGYTSEVRETRQNLTYHVLKSDKPQAGLFASPWQHDTAIWLPYVRVENPGATAEKAVQLGGTTVLAPSADIRNGSLAIILDPDGAPLALQKFPFTEARP